MYIKNNNFYQDILHIFLTENVSVHFYLALKIDVTDGRVVRAIFSVT